MLLQDEQIVDRYLQLLKKQEFSPTKKTGFPPSRPLKETLDTTVHSDVYRVLKMLSKGGLLHSHEGKNDFNGCNSGKDSGERERERERERGEGGREGGREREIGMDGEQ